MITAVMAACDTDMGGTAVRRLNTRPDGTIDVPMSACPKYDGRIEARSASVARSNGFTAAMMGALAIDADRCPCVWESK